MSRRPGRGVGAGPWMATAGLLLLGSMTGDARAQTLERALAETRDGVVGFTLPLRPDVLVCRRGLQFVDDPEDVSTRARYGEGCAGGAARVEVELRDGRVRRTRLLARDERTTPADLELGRLSAGKAVAALLRVARTESGRAAESAVALAAVTDSVEVWPELLEIARDRARPEEVRKTALFHVGRDAAASTVGGLDEAARDPTETHGVREAAVFALAQRPPEEGVPILMDLAETAPDADTRRSAFFWLAQSDDPRVPGFFARILAGPA